MAERQRDIFKTITCPGCGGNFKPIPGEYGHYRCKLCKAYEAYQYNGEIIFVDMFADLDEEETYSPGQYIDDRPLECTGCGSDNYPECRESCGYFDD